MSEQTYRSPVMDKLEVVAYERFHPTSGWLPVGREDAPHYLGRGQDIRALTPHVPAQAEIDRLREENTRWLLRIADIRIAAGVNERPMLDELPGEIAALRARALTAEAEVACLQRLLDNATGDLNTAEAQVFTLRGELEKAIRMLSDSKKHALTRIVDARDVLILSKRIATLKDTPHD